MAKDSLLEINNILQGYCDDLQEMIDIEAKRITNQGKNKLKIISPKRTGEYAKNWSVSNESGRGYVKYVIYNKNKWQLTHLLESGHKITRKGVRVGVANARVHIKPVEEECIKLFENAVKKIIEGRM